jgi:predicted dehydrogenase
MPEKTISRRELLKASVGALAALSFRTSFAHSLTQRRDDLVRFAVIGVSGQGRAHLSNAARRGVIVALCDVDAERRARAVAEYPDAVAFEDYRQMFDRMHKDIDAVCIATPDHHHAPSASIALQLRKHVYCEKPLTRTLYEARTLAHLARNARVVTQMGNQGTASAELRKVAKLIQQKAFGNVKEVHCWTDRASGWWPQGVNRPDPETPPKVLDWNLWLGPAPERPYGKGYHPFAWRGWWDFGTGALGDIGCHCMNLPFMALDLRDPIAVQAETSGHNKDSFPLWSVVRYEFPARGDRPPLTLTWYDGGKKPPQDLAPQVTFGANGCLIVCEKETLYSPNEYGGGTVRLSGEPMPEVEVVAPQSHFDEFVDAILQRTRATSDFVTYAGPLTETVLLGNLAVWQSGERLEWDARRLRVKGADLEERIKPPYRQGWKL